MMALHCDHIHSIFDGEKKGIPILSILGTLNEDYGGGKFIMFDDYEVPFKTGDVVIFPGWLLHRTEKNNSDKLRITINTNIQASRIGPAQGVQTFLS